jgi:serine/threonine protein kinase
MLEGKVLDGGWTVGPIIVRQPGQTGGRFSASYTVSNADGRKGFLKAIDLSFAFTQPDPAAAQKPLIDAYLFERNLLRECAGRRMDRIVLHLADGDIMVDPAQAVSRVPYLIFERGEGDIRIHLSKLGWVEVAWALRALHHIAVGLLQLHVADVAHQDLKPSNIVMITPNESKVGDLGHAVRKGHLATRPEHAHIGGDPEHAPPEQLYGAIPSDWLLHRFGGDLYNLGSMVVFMFARTHMTALLFLHLHQKHRPAILNGSYSGTYANVLPLLRDAFDRAVTAFCSEVPETVRAPLVQAVRQLCDPDVQRRGHPRARALKHGNPLALDNYVSLFNHLATKVERSLKIRTT